jgi:imidazole glycerol-phosphate synthase subunit HisH
LVRSVLVVDYGMGNLRSLSKAIERAGANVSVTQDPRAIAAADRLVIPGQGAFGQAMERIAAVGLVDLLREHIARAKPLLGVCLGLQLLYSRSEEAPGVDGLCALPGAVSLLPLSPGLKRPHMGWTPVAHSSTHPVLAANVSEEAFYFVHSYAAADAPGFDAATAVHGAPFIAAIAKDAVVATQFHPEKSQDAGERLLRAWLSL